MYKLSHYVLYEHLSDLVAMVSKVNKLNPQIGRLNFYVFKPHFGI